MSKTLKKRNNGIEGGSEVNIHRLTEREKHGKTIEETSWRKKLRKQRKNGRAIFEEMLAEDFSELTKTPTYR